MDVTMAIRLGCLRHQYTYAASTMDVTMAIGIGCLRHQYRYAASTMDVTMGLFDLDVPLERGGLSP